MKQRAGHLGRLLRSATTAGAVALGALALVIAGLTGTSIAGAATTAPARGAHAQAAGARAGHARAKALPGRGKPTFVLGDKNFAEEFILGDLYEQALEAKGYHIKLKANLGTTGLAWKALKAGQIQGYPEYDGTLLSTVAGISKNPKSAKAAERETRKWLKQRGYLFTRVTPFTDSDAIAVTKPYAKAHHLKTLADLKSLGAAVKLGAPPEFGTRYPDGLLGLQRIYHVHPTFDPLNIGSFYTALDNNEINAALVFTTDPPLASGKYVVLKDTKFIFGFQNVGVVLKRKTAKAEGPAFIKTINRVSRLLTQKAIIKLDGAVEVDKLSAKKVARAFLKANHLL